MKKHIVLSLLIILPFMAVAQGVNKSYNTGIGLRLGGIDGGLTIKHFLTDNAAFEGIIGSHGYAGGINLTGLYELHAQAFDNPQFMWFYGAGGHIGFYNGRKYKDHHGVIYSQSFVNVGVEGIVGLEYQIKAIPLSLGVDLKPTIDILNPVGFGGYPNGAFYVGGAFSVRYTF